MLRLLKKLTLGILWLITLPFWIFLFLIGYKASYRLLYFLAWPLMRFLFRIKIKGQENLPKKGNYLVVARHRSCWDILAIGLAIKRPMRWVARAGIGLGFLKRYTISINPEKPKSRDLKRIYQALEKGEIVGIFPEGTRNPKKQKLNPGVIHFAKRANKKIVPVAILAKGPYGLGKARFWHYLLGQTRLEVIINPPITIEELESHLSGQETKRERGQKLTKKLFELV